MEKMSKSMPSLQTDTDAEKFVETSDLSQYDLSDFKPMQFEIDYKKGEDKKKAPKGDGG